MAPGDAADSRRMPQPPQKRSIPDVMHLEIGGIAAIQGDKPISLWLEPQAFHRTMQSKTAHQVDRVQREPTQVAVL